jgi:hypothetical protein
MACAESVFEGFLARAEGVLRPSKEAFEYTLRASHQLWSTYFETSDTRLPLEWFRNKLTITDGLRGECIRRLPC